MCHYWIVKGLEVLKVKVVTVHPNGRFIVASLIGPSEYSAPFPWPKLKMYARPDAAYLVLSTNCRTRLLDIAQEQRELMREVDRLEKIKVMARDSYLAINNSTDNSPNQQPTYPIRWPGHNNGRHYVD